MNLRALLVALIALSATMALLAPPRSQAAELDVTKGAEWPAREITVALNDGARIDADAVGVLENGKRVSGVKLIPPAADGDRGVVLVLDASRSMAGGPITEALHAARDLVDERSAEVPFGVVLFARTPRVALAPTTDADAIEDALAVGPELRGGSDIIRASQAGLRSLRHAGLAGGTLVVLSDGAQTSKRDTTVAQLADEAASAHARIFTVGLRSDEFDGSTLVAIATATEGEVAAAERPDELPGLLDAIGRKLSTQHTITYDSRVAAGDRVEVAVTLDGGQIAHTYYTAPDISLDDAKPLGAEPAAGLDAPWLVGLAGAMFLLVGGCVLFFVRAGRRSLVARVDDFTGSAPAAPTPARPVPARSPRKEGGRAQRAADAIELSGIGLSLGTLAWLTAAAAALLGLWVSSKVGSTLLGIGVALVVPIAVRMFVLHRLKRRRNAFGEQLADSLQVLASALRAGHSFSAALAGVADDAPEPSRSEFRRAAQDEQLGVQVEEALDRVSRRMAAPEIEYVGLVAGMQRETGGNTAEILDRVIETIRERQRIHSLVRTLTAQGRMGGIIISLLPIGAAVGMATLSPGYFDAMLESSTGRMLLAIGVAMMAAGWLSIRKIVTVEV